MGRIMGRSMETYNLSKTFMEAHFPKYKRDKRVIDLAELGKSPNLIRDYLPERAVDFIRDHQVVVVRNFMIPHELTIFPDDIEKQDPYMIIHNKPLEEHKRILVYFLGGLLNRLQDDRMDLNALNIPCQYASVLPILFDSLYMKESGRADDASLRFLHELRSNAKRYIKAYEDYNKSPETNDMRQFIVDTLLFLIQFSSMDAALQIMDKFGDDKEQMKKLIEELIVNENGNQREEILLDRGIETVGYKALRKEIEGKKIR